MDGIRPASSSSPQRNMELRCSSEPSAMGLEAELRGGTHLPLVTGQETELRAGAHIPAQYMKLAASSIPMANHNHLAHNGSTGLAGGARVSIQSRPGSSQLVHIPEEENLTSRDQESESEDSIMDGGGSVREKWLRVAEKTTIPCRPLSAGGQPRLMQVNHSISLPASVAVWVQFMPHNCALVQFWLGIIVACYTSLSPFVTCLSLYQLSTKR